MSQKYVRTSKQTTNEIIKKQRNSMTQSDLQKLIDESEKEVGQTKVYKQQ